MGAVKKLKEELTEQILKSLSDYILEEKMVHIDNQYEYFIFLEPPIYKMSYHGNHEDFIKGFKEFLDKKEKEND